jgi:hypothetical protein
MLCLPFRLSVSDEALAGATTPTHAAKGLHRGRIDRHHPDRTIGFNNPFQALGGAKGKARPYGGRDHGLSAGRDGAAHGRDRLG